jgi:hypothetical protein
VRAVAIEVDDVSAVAMVRAVPGEAEPAVAVDQLLHEPVTGDGRWRILDVGAGDKRHLVVDHRRDRVPIEAVHGKEEPGDNLLDVKAFVSHAD